MTEKELIRELALIAAGQKGAPEDHHLRSQIRNRGWGGWSFDQPAIYDEHDRKFHIFPEGWAALKKAADETSTL